MICLKRHGIVLRQIGLDDIEQVRLWRNHPDVKRYMVYRDEITPEMQRQWYEGVQDRGDLYFIIHAAENDVGVINLKEIDFQTGVAESGIFMAGNDHFHSIIPFQATFCIFDFAFQILKLVRIRSHILDDNSRAIRFNKALGFEPTNVITNELNRCYYLDKKKYYNSVKPCFSRILN